MALEKLGYAPGEVEEIVAFIDERNTVVGAPHVKTEHYPVFDCAIGERAIHYMGHVKMMGAVQPFISGAISKTVNLPETATVDEVAKLLRRGVEARRQGDRDLPRQLQGRAAAVRQEGRRRTTLLDAAPQLRRCRDARRRLPDDRTEVGRKFRVGDYEGYIHVGLYEDGTPGDIFVDIAKEGTTLAGLMNSFMISVSLGLQYGVPLEVYVSKFAHMRFEPSGLTNDADIRVAKSIVDYIFRWMGKKFLTADQQEEIGILSPEVRARLAEALRNGGDAPAVGQGAGRDGAARPDGALQRWEDAVECAKVRRPHGADRVLLHVPGLRDEHRLLVKSRPVMRLRPPSPALVIACLALAVALSGGAYAVSTALPRNSVGSAQLKANAVNSAKVQNRSLRAVDFGIGQIPKGPQGPAGAAGPQGPPGTSGVQQISSTGPSNSTGPKSFQVDCPSGKRAIGGGGTLIGTTTNTFLTTSRPSDAGTGWVATGRESSGGNAGNWAVQAWVVCATVAP